MLEEWVEIKSYESIYEVSNTGKVRSVEGKITQSTKHGTRIWTARELKQKTDKKGYKRVSLYKENTRKDFLVHRLVALAFSENPDNKAMVNHKDGKPSNNYSTNLEWSTSTENVNHAFDTKLMTTSHEVTLISKATGQSITFRSMAKAGLFLGKNHGYISALLKRGITETDSYKILV